MQSSWSTHAKSTNCKYIKTWLTFAVLFSVQSNPDWCLLEFMNSVTFMRIFIKDFSIGQSENGESKATHLA